MAPFDAFPIALVLVALWGGSGLGLLWAFRRSTSRVLLRLAAAFSALWAILATTLLAGILSMGGWPALLRLVQSPLYLLEPEHAAFWVAGALGAFAVLSAAFLLNQLVGRGLLAVLVSRPIAWPAGLRPRPDRTSLLRFESQRLEAFSFALVEFDRRPPGVRRRELILLSAALLDRLSPEEVEAVVAHELGHVQLLDARYLTFFRTFARMMRWDPVLAGLARTLTRHEEFRADDQAIRMTRRPRALARALYKVLTESAPRGKGRTAIGLLGVPGRGGRRDALARIERLLRLAESPEFRGERCE
jgi:Zn-dependent protease with chaperone function